MGIKLKGGTLVSVSDSRHGCLTPTTLGLWQGGHQDCEHVVEQSFLVKREGKREKDVSQYLC